ncbi:hypothetical protein [Cohnella sp. GCM10012308]|uniref:hypothetical protein n=1 Tax=Cohnella sp. GCM10012308 TaxID=3317329 RepID=UPI003623B15C
MSALRVGILVLFIALVGCSGGSGAGFKADTFSDKDMCIVQTEGEATICYGAPRTDVEKILGSGKESDLTNFTSYEDGIINIAYRDDLVAAIGLGEDSKGNYKTARGAEAGMTKDELKKLYGKKHAIEAREQNLDYAYDNKNNKYVSDLTGQPPEELLQTYAVSVMFNEEGRARSIMLLDRKMAMLNS